jgi:holdfast attachment protein HfaA
MTKTMTLLAAAAAFAALAMPAQAGGVGAADGPNMFEQPINTNYGDLERPIEISGRGPNGNRMVINGRIIDDGSSLPLGLGFGGVGPSGVEQATALGNQLNVVTQGSFNTVIIDAEQINNGNQNATTDGGQ